MSVHIQLLVLALFDIITQISSVMLLSHRCESLLTNYMAQLTFLPG